MYLICEIPCTCVVPKVPVLLGGANEGSCMHVIGASAAWSDESGEIEGEGEERD